MGVLGLMGVDMGLIFLLGFKLDYFESILNPKAGHEQSWPCPSLQTGVSSR